MKAINPRFGHTVPTVICEQAYWFKEIERGHFYLEVSRLELQKLSIDNFVRPKYTQGAWAYLGIKMDIDYFIQIKQNLGHCFEIKVYDGTRRTY